MNSREIINIDQFSLDIKGKKRRRLLRILVPILCVLVMVGAILGIAAYSYTHNRRDALALSDKLVKALDRQIATQVATYLAPMSDMVNIAASLLKDGGAGHDPQKLTESLGIEIIKTFPQIVAFSIGDPDGNFLMTKKMVDGAVDTKIIERKTGQRDVRWVRRNRAGDTIAVEASVDDAYDPRVRPWYRGALTSGGIYLTEVYIFFTDQKPGITASMAIRDHDNRVIGIISLDLLLEELSVFLKSLQIGDSGRALIIDSRGYLIAFPEMERMIKHADNQLLPVKVEALGDEILTRAYNRFRIEGHGIRSLALNGRRYISMASALPLSAENAWSIMIVVPETEFIGFVRQNLRAVLFMSLGIVLLTAALAGLLAWQGMRADRNAQLVLENRRQFEAQGEAFSEVANEAALFDPTNPDAIGRLTEIVAQAIDVRRTSVWRLDKGGAGLACEDAYDRESKGHTQGIVLKRRDLVDLFDALARGDEIALGRSEQDPRTAEFHRVYLHPLGCSALMLLPVRVDGTTAGALMLADAPVGRRWSSQELTFARAITGMLAVRFGVRKEMMIDECKPYPGEPHPEMAAAAPIEGGPTGGSTHDIGPSGKMNRFYDRLTDRGLTRDRIGAEVFSDVAVFVLRFTDTLTLAGRLENAPDEGAMDHLIRHTEELAYSHGIDYLKIMSGEMIGAAGFGGEAAAHAATMADMALAVQEKCRHVFADLDTSMDFRIGLDMGPVIGSILGEQQNFYNLWGDAVRTALLMAETGVPGGIHVTESVYRPLRSSYIFKLRGAYYLEEAGEIQTYLLTGRL